MDEKEEKGKGFRVVDRRHFTAEGVPVDSAGDEQAAERAGEGGAAGAAAPADPGARAEGTEPTQQKKSFKDRLFGRGKKNDEADSLRAEEAPSADEELAEIDFASFLLSLITSAYIHLGDAPDPITKKRQRSLPLAKQTIDLLALLSEKTRGNLTPDESRLLDGALYDLRLRYIQLDH